MKSFKCDLCKKEFRCDVLFYLYHDYQTKNTKEICNDCKININTFIANIKKCTAKIESEFIRTFIEKLETVNKENGE